jgi:uncharacterized protein (DUF427 family)
MPDRSSEQSAVRVAESVWDYPRPPSLEPVAERITVHFAGETIADTIRAIRVLETSHPPVYYLPPGDVRQDLLVPAHGRSLCEFKGEASYVSIVAGGRRSERAGWLYSDPTPSFRPIAGCVAFYASRVDEARVGDERVVSQPGDFYGGWITSWVTGPFKGGPGTRGW